MIGTDTPVWTRVLDGLKHAVGEERFNLWFRNTTALAAGDGELVIGVPNLFVLDWLRSHYGPVIGRCAEEAMGAPVAIRFQVDGALFRGAREEQSRQEAEFLAGAGGAPLGAPAGRPAPPVPRMRLENFVVGDCNHLAYTAACEVVRAPGQVFNPLFLHGSVGLGKTHLLQGILQALDASATGRACLYLTCEDFTNQYITAMRTRALDSFRKRFRRLDVLVIDDVHFLTNKPSTQEEFLHTFNTLVDTTGKQVVLASDSHPKAIRQLKESLTTRFVSGMVARLEAPDEGTRLRILRLKAARAGAVCAPGVLEFLAGRLEGSVRELEGALTMLVAHGRLAAAARRDGAASPPEADATPRAPLRIDLEAAHEVVACLTHSNPVRPGLADVERVVAAGFGVPARDLQSASRRRTLAFPRQVAMFLARKHTDCSLGDIGQRFGGRDHSTVAGACKRLTRLIEADPDLRQLVENLEARLTGKR